jgi:flagellar biosynthetic protein FliR
MTFTVEQFEFYLFILVRISAFVFSAPFLSNNHVPARVKIGFSMSFALLLFWVLPFEQVAYVNMFGLTTALVKEAIVGLILGFLANAAFHILAFTGHMLDTEIGFGMVQELDPTTGMQVTITSNLYSYSVMLMMLITGLHRPIIKAIADSYRIIPVDRAFFRPTLYQLFLDFLVQYFIVGFRIALPMFASILLLNVVLAVLAKVAPQMNMFVIGLQLKVLVGLIVLSLMIGMLPSVSDFIFNMIDDFLGRGIQGLRP